jgi:hypothetical protein
MVNNTTTWIIGNISEQIENNVIGAGDTINGVAIGSMLIGAVIILTFLLLIWKSRLGLFGALVVMPPLIIILSKTYLDKMAWLQGVMWILVGILIGIIVLELWRENR